MNTLNICLCILVTIIIRPSSATLSDFFGGQDSGPAPQVRQIQQFGQLAQQLQMLAPNPVQILGQIGQYGPQLLELANQAQKFFSEEGDNDLPQLQQQQQQSPQLGRPSVPQGQFQGQGQGQGQGQRFGPPIRQQQQQIQFQQQQRNKQSPQFNLNQIAPQSLDSGDIYYGPELDSPPEVVHVHRHIIEHVGGQSGYGGGGNSQSNQNDQNVRVYKIIHEQGNGLGNGYGNGYGGGYGYKYGNRI